MINETEFSPKLIKNKNNSNKFFKPHKDNSLVQSVSDSTDLTHMEDIEEAKDDEQIKVIVSQDEDSISSESQDSNQNEKALEDKQEINLSQNQVRYQEIRAGFPIVQDMEHEAEGIAFDVDKEDMIISSQRIDITQ